MATQPRLPRILVADTGAAVCELRAAVGGEVELVATHTLEQAVRSLRDAPPQLVVVGYHFDELRPFRFIQYAREALRGRGVPMILVRALPVHLGATTDAQLQEAYRTLGVDLYLNLFDDAQRQGHAAAVDRLRHALRAVLWAP